VAEENAAEAVERWENLTGRLTGTVFMEVTAAFCYASSTPNARMPKIFTGDPFFALGYCCGSGVDPNARTYQPYMIG